VNILGAIRSALKPPLFAAGAFTISESVQLMHRPDSIYIPIIVEAPIFILGYMAFAIVSLFCVAPLCHFLFSKGGGIGSGLLFAAAIALGGTFAVYAVELFGHKASIFHRAYIFGSLIPLFVLAATSIYFQKRHGETEGPDDTTNT